MNMKRLYLVNQARLSFTALFIISTTTHAGTPLWSFSPNGSPVVSVSAIGTEPVSYTITNNSKKSHSLVLSSKTPAGIVQSGGPCVLAPKSPTNPNPTCILNLSINGSALPANNISGGPVLCQTNSNGTPNPNQCYQPGPGDTLVITRTTAPGATTLSTSIASPAILALSVKNTSLNPALTGNARQITIKNTGANVATGISVSVTGLPAGTNITTVPTTCSGTLAANATCTVTVTPGAKATSNCHTGIAPTSGIITVSAVNVATAVTTNVVVLSYGCQYQGGFLYSVNDTTSNIGSISGKVASLIDQAAPNIGVPWSSNGSGGVSYDIIPLITETTALSADYSNAKTTFDNTYNTIVYHFPDATSFHTCDGANDGQCNTGNILALYKTYTTGYGIGTSPYTLSPGETSPLDYAEGLCAATINTYSDWYLPAICEMDSISTSVAPLSCPSGAQSMFGNLFFLIGDPSVMTPSNSCSPPSGTSCLAGTYWSSTEYSLGPQFIAWSEDFDKNGITLEFNNKTQQFGVRCSRVLIP